MCCELATRWQRVHVQVSTRVMRRRKRYSLFAATRGAARQTFHASYKYLPLNESKRNHRDPPRPAGVSLSMGAPLFVALCSWARAPPQGPGGPVGSVACPPCSAGHTAPSRPSSSLAARHCSRPTASAMRADAATRKTRIGHAIAHPPLARAAARARGPLQGGQARPRGALPLLTPARMRPLAARRGARAPLGARALWRPSGGAADIRLPHAGARRAPNPRRGFFDRCSRPLVSSSAACARTLQRALTALRGGARHAH